jgi:hypothetical protein
VLAKFFDNQALTSTDYQRRFSNGAYGSANAAEVEKKILHELVVRRLEVPKCPSDCCRDDRCFGGLGHHTTSIGVFAFTRRRTG